MLLFKTIFSRQQVTGLAHFVRYALVSGVALAVDVGILVLCYKVLGLNYLIAASIGFAVGVAVNYLLSIWWVFTTSRFSTRSVEFFATAIIATTGLALNDLMMWLMVEHLALYYLFAKLIAAIVVFFWNFVIRKYYIHAALVSEPSAG